MKQYHNKKKNLLFVASLSSAMTLAISASAWALEEVGVVGANSATLNATSEDGVVRTLKQGDAIYLNDNLTTDKSGRAQIIFKDRSTVSINENAQIRVDSFVYNPKENKGKLSLNSVKGVFRFIGGALSKKNPVEVHTPVATIGIRGGIVDAHVEAGSGETDAVFVYGKEMTVANANGETVSTTAIGSGFSLDKAGDTPQPMTQEQVTQSVTSFKKTEGGATEGVKKVPTREDVKVKVQSIKTEDKQPESQSEQGNSGQDSSSNLNDSEAESSNKEDSADNETNTNDATTSSDTATNETGAATSDAGTSEVATGSDVAPSTSVTGGATAPEAPKVSIASFEALTPTLTTDISSVKQTVVAATNDAITSKAVDIVNDSVDVGSDAPTTPTTPVVPKTPVVLDGSGTDTKVETSPATTSSGSSTATAPSVTAPVVVNISQGGGFAGSASNAMAAAGIVKLNTYDGIYGLETSLGVVPIASFAPATNGDFSFSTTDANSVPYTVSGYNVGYGAMSVLHVVNDTSGVALNAIVGNAITSAANFSNYTDATGEGFYRIMPELNEFQTTAQFAQDVADARAGHEGLYINWAERWFMNVDMDWQNHGVATVGVDRNKVFVGRIDPNNATTKVTGKVIEFDRAGDTSHVVRSGEIASRTLFANDSSEIEGVHVVGTVTNQVLGTTKTHEVPLVRDVTVELPWMANNAATTDKTLSGYAAGVITSGVGATATQEVYTSGDALSRVHYSDNITSKSVGMTIAMDNLDATKSVASPFGTSGSSQVGVLAKDNTYAATGMGGKGFVVSGNLTGVQPERTDYEYTQWGVWGGAANAAATQVAELVPYVVGQVTQNAGELSGYASYEGDAYASVAGTNGMQNYHGTMSAAADFNNKKLASLQVTLPNVVGNDNVGRELKVMQYTLADINQAGNATLSGGTSKALYNGTYYYTGVNVNGAFFGTDAQEMGGNFAFSNVAGLQGAGVYQGVATTSTIERTTP